jgi:isoquinoline 1-oxidoreductase beta subunit
VQRVRAAVDERGRPITWENRAAGQSNNGYWHPEAAAADSEHPETVQYAIRNRRSEFIYVGGAVPIGAWRSVRHSQNVFCTESFADELAHAAHADPLEYRLALLDSEPRAQAALRAVRDLSGWSKPLAKGRGRGVAYMKYGGSYVAQVAEVTVPANGAVRVDRISCAFDCGQIINPDTLRAQLESAIVWGLSAALWGEITVRGGETVQSNFHDYRVARMADMPVIDIQLLASHEEPSGAGEPGVPCVAPAIANAIFAASGRRMRKLPLSRGAH